MTPVKPASPAFREGDAVVLRTGSYQGTPGVFLRLKEDAKWAEITETDGSVRSHPLEWLAPRSVLAAGPKFEL
jgi:hypothetical protein